MIQDIFFSLITAAGGAAALVGFWLLIEYNKFTPLLINMKNQHSNIEIQYQRRKDLKESLEDVVKSYKTFESRLQESVTSKRSSSSPKAKGGLGIAATVENYPNPKADEQHNLFMEQISSLESDILLQRESYNKSVNEYNTAISLFPGNIAASIMQFKKQEFFKV